MPFESSCYMNGFVPGTVQDVLQWHKDDFKLKMSEYTAATGEKPYLLL